MLSFGSFARLCVLLLICGYCRVSISSLHSGGCLDFNNIDVCKDDRLDDLQMSFGECNSVVTPYNARREPVVKYDNADEVYCSTCGEKLGPKAVVMDCE